VPQSATAARAWSSRLLNQPTNEAAGGANPPAAFNFKTNKKTKIMKNHFSKIVTLMVLLFLAIGVVCAQELAYTTAPLSGDSDLVLRNKQAVAISRMERGNTSLNITANGTNNVAGPVVLDRVVVGTAGATSVLVLSEVTASATNAIATISTTNQASLHLNVRVAGTLRAVTTGGTPANLTLGYR